VALTRVLFSADLVLVLLALMDALDWLLILRRWLLAVM
jgi:hypothetical protein